MEKMDNEINIEPLTAGLPRKWLEWEYLFTIVQYIINKQTDHLNRFPVTIGASLDNILSVRPKLFTYFFLCFYCTFYKFTNLFF